jgi:tetratricopeptide (TPR) repeat protein
MPISQPLPTIKKLKKTLKKNPLDVHAVFSLANAYKQAGNLKDAQSYYSEALKLQPEHFAALLNLGNLFLEIKDVKQAQTYLNKAVTVKPDSPDAHYSYSFLMKELDDLNGALKSLQTVIRLNPMDIEARNHIAALLSECRYYNEAIAFYKRTIELSPSYAPTYNNLGNTYREICEPELASLEYLQALALNPDYADARLNYCAVQLLQGNFELGFEVYGKIYKQIYALDLQGLGWATGESHYDTLVIRTQAGIGIGDIIMYARLLQQPKNRSIKYVLELEERMMPIFLSSFPQLELIDTRKLKKLSSPKKSTMQTSIACLPNLLAIDNKNDLSAKPYMKPNNTQVQELRNKYQNLSPSHDNLIVGISWSTKGRDPNKRTVPIEQWSDVLNIKGVTFVSLQYGVTENQLDPELGIHTDSEIDPLKNVDLAFSQISAMDLVITIDNSCLHFAGSMGIETLALIPFSPDWRWMLNKESTYWYDSVSLIRQDTPINWHNPINTIKQSIETKVNQLKAASRYSGKANA